MISLSNGLSFSRAPLAFLFLIENTSLRIAVIILAMLTDSIDGYLARKHNSATQFGAILDPAMDKFFVFFILGVLLFEHKIETWQACAMIARDFSLCVFAIYLGLSGHWNTHEFSSVKWSKITTAVQFLILIGITLQISFPWYFYAFFIFSGALVFLELLQMRIRKSTVNRARNQ